MKLWGQPTKGRSEDRPVIGARGDPTKRYSEAISELDILFAVETAGRTRELLNSQGWCLWRCQALGGDTIAVVRDDSVEGVPKDMTVYTNAELAKIFPRGSLVSRQTLKLIHEAKRHGAIVNNRVEEGGQ